MSADIPNNSIGSKNPDTEGWVFGPDVRGTIDIVYGCAVVLITAVWTVIHINIPARGESDWKSTLRRFRWGCVSIFAPDFLTLVAAAQWDATRKSIVQMRELPEVQEDEERWSAEHAFYANSGGFLLQCPDAPAFPVNAASIHYLVSKKHIDLPDITRDEIWDKSKADVFAKGAAILQGSWMIVGSIARAVQHLPLSPLELFTLAFVVSTSMSYFFWWRKPQNVSTATMLFCKHRVADIRAEAGVAIHEYQATPLDFVEAPLQAWRRRDMWNGFDLEAGAKTTKQSDVKGSAAVSTNTLKGGEHDSQTKDGNKSLSNVSSPTTQSAPKAPEPDSVEQMSPQQRKDSQVTLVGRQLSDLALLSPLSLKKPEKKKSQPDSNYTINSNASTLIGEEQWSKAPIRRIPDDAILPTRLPLKVLMGLILPSLIHSCIHLLGWNSHYPTNIEKQLWRASAITLAAMSCIAVGAVRVLAIVGYKGRFNLVWFWVNTSFESSSQPYVDEATKGGHGTAATNFRSWASGGIKALRSLAVWDWVLALATLCLVVARCFIIIEVIISLRSMPKETYITVNWLGFIPHV